MVVKSRISLLFLFNLVSSVPLLTTGCGKMSETELVDAVASYNMLSLEDRQRRMDAMRREEAAANASEPVVVYPTTSAPTPVPSPVPAPTPPAGFNPATVLYPPQFVNGVELTPAQREERYHRNLAEARREALAAAQAAAEAAAFAQRAAEAEAAALALRTPPPPGPHYNGHPPVGGTATGCHDGEILAPIRDPDYPNRRLGPGCFIVPLGST